MTYDRICGVDFPGLVFADKSESLRAVLSRFAYSPVNILRRPKGFGKTTFLSMLDAFFDAYSRRAYFPFEFGDQDMTARPFHAHNRLLVYALDLAELNVNIGTEVEEYESCERFLYCGAQRFLERYKEAFAEDEAVKAGTLIPSFFGILGLLRRHGWKLFVTIDNYTAPVIQDGPRSSIGRIISSYIIRPLARFSRYGQIVYIMIVGEEPSHDIPWVHQTHDFEDLTDNPAFADAIGFTPDEVTALGEVLSVDILKELPSTSSEPPDTRFVYAAAHVVSVARDLVETGSCRPRKEYPYKALSVAPDSPAGSPPVRPAPPVARVSDDSVDAGVCDPSNATAWNTRADSCDVSDELALAEASDADESDSHFWP
ncbi:hypothetical protein AURDEDRAFT_162598 [Auricularia subglabra TFB-10046 SS5]|nr:hypothetical protein AURDEDRAFT_162598 [Auricularia subglabra TFB-10046 SS5]